MAPRSSSDLKDTPDSAEPGPLTDVNEGPFDAYAHLGDGVYQFVKIGQPWPTVSTPTSVESNKEA